MKKPQVNFKMVEVARISRGLTQPKLAEQIGITQGTLSKIENGQIVPGDDIVEKISHELRYPLGFFNEDINVLPSLTVNYRKRKALTGLNLDEIQYSLYIMKHVVKKLLKAVEFQNKMFYLTPDEFGDPETIAQLIREKWKVPRGPIKNLTNLVESAGVIVLLVEVNNEKLDGEVVPDEDGLPVIYLNKNLSGDRLRFTLAHELGHLVMHTGDYLPTFEDAEIEANAFASELLMPSDDIRYQLDDNLNPSRLGDLKMYWKVSMAALIRRALTLNIIDDAKYRSLNVRLSQAGYKKKEPEMGVTRESPTIVKQVFDIYLNRLNYTIQEIAEVISLREDELTAIIDLYNGRTLRPSTRESVFKW